MNKLFPTYEVGSMPKLNARVKALRGELVAAEDLSEIQTMAHQFSVEADQAIDILKSLKNQSRKLTAEEESALTDLNIN